MNEIEKQFFDTFGIEPKYEDSTCDMDDKCRYTDCNTCQRINKFNYPQITDRILLELICAAHISPVITFVSRDVERLKEEVLTVLCHWVNRRDIKNRVQEIFKRCNNHDR